VTRDGALLARDALVLDAADGAIDERMGRFDAFATLLAIGEAAAPVTRSVLEEAPLGRELAAAASPIGAPSQIAGGTGACLRIAGASPSGVVGEARRRLRNLPDIDAVDPFASRH
jgi:urease accessory protein